MWEAEGWRAEMIKLGGKMPTLTHQIHLYSENINIQLLKIIRSSKQPPQVDKNGTLGSLK